MHTQQLTHIAIGNNANDFAPVSLHTMDAVAFARQEAHLQETVLKFCPANLWHHGSYALGCPRPILVGSHHQQQVKLLHEALKTAVTDIVQRWWSDKNARFPERMPLERKEEEILQWIEAQVKIGALPHFSQCLGSWRPDFLVEETRECEENFCITEINARFSFNGFLHEAYGQEAINQCVAGDNETTELVGATEPEMILQGLFSLFDPKLPLYLLKDAEDGIDIHMFIEAVWQRFGIKPRLVKPQELRLVPDARSKTGYRLCCVIKGHDDPAINSWRFRAKNGEIWEEIQQVGLELKQRELEAMDSEVLRQVSLRCFNDLRTVLLVHDKRMLGIIRQEIPQLVTRGVITEVQGQALYSGIVETILPGSEELHNLMDECVSNPQQRHGYILKSIRSGKGDGIVFGEDLTGDEWTSRLDGLRSAKIIPGVSCVVQRRIIPRNYDLVLRASRGLVQYPIVGTYHVVNGSLLGLGTWRSSGDRVVAVSSGGSWLCSVIRRERIPAV